eukprot:19303-Heterococcus_DN1.PRE.1
MQLNHTYCDKTLHFFELLFDWSQSQPVISFHTDKQQPKQQQHIWPQRIDALCYHYEAHWVLLWIHMYRTPNTANTAQHEDQHSLVAVTLEQQHHCTAAQEPSHSLTLQYAYTLISLADVNSLMSAALTNMSCGAIVPTGHLSCAIAAATTTHNSSNISNGGISSGSSTSTHKGISNQQSLMLRSAAAHSSTHSDVTAAAAYAVSDNHIAAALMQHSAP